MTKRTVDVPQENEVQAKLISFIPLLVALFGFINMAGISAGWWEELPFTTEEFTYGLNLVAGVVGTVWAWFRNNNVTKKGLQREAVANQAVPKKAKAVK